MKIGFNLLLWSTHLDESQLPVVEDLKRAGYHGVEVPVFQGDEAHYRAMARRLGDLGLERTVVSVVPSADLNPLDADPGVRAKAVDFLKRVLDNSAALGATNICGPLHSTLGHFTGIGPTEDERKRCVEFHQTVGDHAKSLGIPITLEAIQYDGWLTIEAFGRGLAELAAATKVWRDFFPDPRQVYEGGFAVIREGWAKA
ncbi:MAG TPA: sugar phosphate isomerase/epimerase [Dongiaceae bacterium]|jgi:D-psicose/D-tagatose/L-ribulose 3-epimerase